MCLTYCAWKNISSDEKEQKIYMYLFVAVFKRHLRSFTDTVRFAWKRRENAGKAKEMGDAIPELSEKVGKCYTHKMVNMGIWYVSTRFPSWNRLTPFT
jgi:hypothetical protein